MKVLITLHARDQNLGGLAIFDIDSGKNDYFLINKGESETDSRGFRGVCAHDNKLYVVDSSTLYIFHLKVNATEFEFSLHNVISRLEWKIGLSGNLTSVFIEHEKNELWLAISGMDAIDRLTLDGKYIGRKYIWEINPALVDEILGPGKPGSGFVFLNCISNGLDKEIFLTLGNMQGSGKGSIIDSRHGKTIVGELNEPYDVKTDNDIIYINEHRSLKVKAFERGANNSPLLQKWTCDLGGQCEITSPAKMRLRGMELLGDVLVCALSGWAGANEQIIPSRIVLVDKKSGQLLKHVSIPECKGFSNVSVFSVVALPGQWKNKITLFSESPWQYFTDGKSAKIAPGTGLLPMQKIIGKENLNETNSLTNGPISVDKLPIITCEDVYLSYRRGRPRLFASRRSIGRYHEALKGVSIEIREGEVVGLIGRNGSGKSTLLKLISGVYSPDHGSINIRKKATSLTLRTGLKNELTGRENIYLRGAYMGIKKSKIKSEIDKIIKFSGLDQFIDDPVRNYSSGMKARLAFSICSVLEAEILLIDEAIATGDDAFREKVGKRVRQLVENASIVVIVSHQMSFLYEVCNRIIWLDEGVVLADGAPGEVIPEYLRFCHAGSM